MMRFVLTFIALVVITGCVATQKYMPMEQSLADQLSFAPVAFGDVTYASGQEELLNSPKVRKGKMTSPYEGSYSEYVRRAFVTELVNAGKYSEESAISLGMELRENTMTSPVTKKGEMSISVNVVVSKAGETRFEKVISVKEAWSVPFVGDDARNKAAKVYVHAMRTLVRSVLTDKDLQKALAGQ